MYGISSIVRMAAAGAVPLRVDPWTAFNFVVELDGLFVGGFSRVEGLSAAIQVEDYFEGGRNDAPRRLLGRTTWQNLVLARGMTELDPMWSWFEAAARGDVRRRSGAILMLDAARVPVSGWVFHDAVPVRWVGPTFDASHASEVAVQRIELAHAGLEQPPWFRALGLAARARSLAESGSDG